jgi:hypothetical protein
MNISHRVHLFVVLLCLSLSPRVHAGLIVDHQPHPSGGLASDTLFQNSIGQTVWQRLADDIVLPSPFTVDRIVWWGFYDRDNPPFNETIRVRFYGARNGDGLPDDGNIIAEESLLNPTRVQTGRLIAVGILPHEYRFESELNTPVTLNGGIKYWLEIVQIGDLSTAFRWEFSLAEQNGFASINSINTNWHAVSLAGDCAFQLIGIPEPSTLSILLTAVFIMIPKHIRQ